MCTGQLLPIAPHLPPKAREAHLQQNTDGQEALLTHRTITLLRESRSKIVCSKDIVELNHMPLASLNLSVHKAEGRNRTWAQAPSLPGWLYLHVSGQGI